MPDRLEEAGEYAERLHPRDRTGKWRSKPGVTVPKVRVPTGRGGKTIPSAEKPAARERTRAVKPRPKQEKVEAQSWAKPPMPTGEGAQKGGKGYSSDEAYGTNTKLGHVGEKAFLDILGGGEILHPEGKGAQSPLDVHYDGYGFEVKAVSTKSTAYKATPKKFEMEDKLAAADELGIKPALAIVVIDTRTGLAHGYYRDGLEGGRLSEGKGWKYLGSASLNKQEAEAAHLQEALAEAVAARQAAAGDPEAFVAALAREQAIREQLQEAGKYTERLHPRSRIGRWVDVMGKLTGKQKDEGPRGRWLSLHGEDVYVPRAKHWKLSHWSGRTYVSPPGTTNVYMRRDKPLPEESPDFRVPVEPGKQHKEESLGRLVSFPGMKYSSVGAGTGPAGGIRELAQVARPAVPEDNRDAIDIVLGLQTGDKFTLRGRQYTISRYSGTTHMEGRSIIPVWNEKGREVRLTVRPGDKVTNIERVPYWQRRERGF